MSAAAVLAAAAAMAMPGMGAPAPASGPGPGPGAESVAIPGKYFTPQDLTVLLGDTVTWRNDDVITHTVTAQDGSFNSGDLSPGVSFQQTFDRPGIYAYHCTIHRQMTGTITVAALGLTGPSGVLGAGAEAMFDVLAPAGSGPITLDSATPRGPFEPTGQIVDPGPDGHARFHVMVDAPARFRARGDGNLFSPVARVAVAPHVATKVKRAGRRVTVRATISPAVPGATVELQRYVRERFDYLPVRTVRSRDGAAVTFRYRTRSRAALRVAVTKAPGGWAEGVSRHTVVHAAH